jgi:hypothetical protein
MRPRLHPTLRLSRALATLALCVWPLAGAVAQPGDPVRQAASAAVQADPAVAAAAATVFQAHPAFSTAAAAVRSARSVAASPPDRTGASSVLRLLSHGRSALGSGVADDPGVMARWYPFVEAGERAALQAVRAAYDLQRQRDLLALADQQLAWLDALVTTLRTAPGASHGTDAEGEQIQLQVAQAQRRQAAARVALQEATRRFEARVGAGAAKADGPFRALRDEPPSQLDQVVATALASHPAISAREAEHGLVFAMHARTRHVADMGDGPPDRGTTSSSQGPVDHARRLAQAWDRQDRACMAVLHDALSAFQVLSAADARMRDAAARIALADAGGRAAPSTDGRRSRLHAIEVSNEVYAARRAQAQANFERAVALAEVWASMGQLTARLGLSPSAAAGGVSPRSPGEAASSRCRTREDGRAMMADASPLGAPIAAPSAGPTGAAAGATPVPQATEPVRSVPSAPQPQPQPQPQPPTDAERAFVTASPRAAPSGPHDVDADVGRAAAVSAQASASVTVVAPTVLAPAMRALLAHWVKAHRTRNVDALAELYAPGFMGHERSRRMWIAKLRADLSGLLPLKFEIDQIEVAPASADRVRLTFRQIQTTGTHMNLVERALVLTPDADRWLIVDDRLL